MAAGTAFRSIGGFDAWIFVAHEMWSMGDEVVVAVVGAKIINTKERNGTAGSANVGSGSGYSGGFASCRTLHPSLAAEGGRVDGCAGEDASHGENFGDVPTGEVTGEGVGTFKRAIESCHSIHIPVAQITGEGRRM